MSEPEKMLFGKEEELYWADLIDPEKQDPSKLTLDDMILLAERDDFVKQLIPSKKHRRALIALVSQIMIISDEIMHESIYMMLIAWYPRHQFNSTLEIFEAIVKYYAGTVNWKDKKEASVILSQIAAIIESINDILEDTKKEEE